jgi:pentose-5-phosphate-3-epimerase
MDEFVGEFVILSYLFSPIIISVALLTAHLFKRKFVFTIPPLLTIIYTIHKIQYIKKYGSSGPGGGFEVLFLPVLGLSVLVISYTLWAGLIYIKKNWGNKRTLSGSIAIFVLLCGILAGSYHYRTQLIIWPRVITNNMFFWDLAFRGYFPAALIRYHGKNGQIDHLERAYVVDRLTYQVNVAPHKIIFSLRESVLEAIADIFVDDPAIPGLITRHPSVTSNLLMRLSKSSNKYTIIAVAENSKTPVEVLTQLYESNPQNAKYGLVKNPNTPISVRVEIVKDDSLDLARDARFYCSNWQECEKVYQIYEVRTNFSEGQFALTKRESVSNYGKLGHPVGNEIWLELSHDPREYIRVWVASNYLTPPEILTSMQNDSSMTILKWLILNNNTPNEIKKKVASKLSTTADQILVQLAKSKSKDFREGVAFNTATPVRLLEELSKDDQVEVRTAVAENPRITAAIIDRLSNDSSRQVLIAVTRNPKTPKRILEKLQDKEGDKYKMVRHLARASLSRRNGGK